MFCDPWRHVTWDLHTIAGLVRRAFPSTCMFVWNEIVHVILMLCDLANHRYMQLPLGYPKERERILKGNHGLLPLLIYDSENGGLIPEPVSCHWSDYYKTHEREPSNTTLAPWVSKMYRRREDVLHKTPEL